MRKLGLLTLFAFFLPSVAFAAVQFDTSVQGIVSQTTSPQTFSMTLNASATAVCVTTIGAVSGTDSTTAVTIGGVAATKMGGAQAPSDRYIDLWCLLNPPTGTQTVSITFSTFLTAFAASYTGVAAIDGGNQNTATAASSFSLTTNSTQSGAWLVGGFHGSNGGTGTAGANTTLRQSSSGQALWLGDSGSALGAAGSYSLNISSGSQNWGGAVAVLEATAPAAAATTPILGLVRSFWLW